MDGRNRKKRRDEKNSRLVEEGNRSRQMIDRKKERKIIVCSKQKR